MNASVGPTTIEVGFLILPVSQGQPSDEVHDWLPSRDGLSNRPAEGQPTDITPAMHTPTENKSTYSPAVMRRSKLVSK